MCLWPFGNEAVPPELLRLVLKLNCVCAKEMAVYS